MRKKLISTSILILFLVNFVVINSLAQTTTTTLPSTYVYVDPVRQTADVGDTVTVTIKVNDVTDLYVFQFDITFDPNVLEAVSISEGDFLSSHGATTGLAGTIDNTLGTITGITCALTGATGATGSGTLATVTFNALADGTSNIVLSNVVLSNSSLTEIPSTSEDGSVTVVTVITTTTTTPVTTTTLEPAKVIMKHINYMVCTLLTIIWYIAAAITALVIVFAGMKYITSDDPREVNKAKNMVVYAIIGLILVIIACPLVDYLIENTDITPFEESCPCLIGIPPGVTTTIPGVTTTTVPGVTTTTLPGVTTTTVPGVTTTTVQVTTTTSTTTTITPCHLCSDSVTACSDLEPICLHPVMGIDIICGEGCADYCCIIGYNGCC